MIGRVSVVLNIHCNYRTVVDCNEDDPGLSFIPIVFGTTLPSIVHHLVVYIFSYF